MSVLYLVLDSFDRAVHPAHETQLEDNMITKADLDNWFEYHKPTEHQIPCFNRLREAAKVFAQAIIDNTPPSPDQTAAVRKVREAVMTANAAIACNEVHVEIEQVANIITFKTYYQGQFIHKFDTSDNQLLAVETPNHILRDFYEMSAKIIGKPTVRPDLIKHATAVACAARTEGTKIKV